MKPQASEIPGTQCLAKPQGGLIGLHSGQGTLTAAGQGPPPRLQMLPEEVRADPRQQLRGAAGQAQANEPQAPFQRLFASGPRPHPESWWHCSSGTPESFHQTGGSGPFPGTEAESCRRRTARIGGPQLLPDSEA